MPTVRPQEHGSACLRVAVSAFCFLMACAAPATTFEGTAVPMGAVCWPGFSAVPGGAGCQPVLPAAACGVGTRPSMGSTTCEPVGIARCAAGFERDSSGWGCVEIAGKSCVGSTMPKLGERECQPVGDCARAWPPANATAFVDPTGPLDATHFRTIQSAVAAQTSAGAVIAVAPGTYVESIQPLRAMTIAGRCAAQVVVESPGGTTSGLRLRSVAVMLEGLTLKGQYTGVAVDTVGKLTLRSCILDGNREMGATVAGSGASLTVEDSLVVGTVSANPAYGRGIQVQAGAMAVIARTAITGNQAFGVFITGAGSFAQMTDTVISDTKADSAGAYGLGVSANEGGSLAMVRSAVFGNRDRNVSFIGGSSSVVDSVIRNGVPTEVLASGFGLIAEEGASVLLERTTLSSNTQTGLGADGNGTEVTAVDCVVRDNRHAGRDSTAVGSRNGGKLTLRGSALIDNQHLALQVAEGASGTIERSIIRGTTAATTTTEARAVEVGKSCASFTDTAVTENVALAMLLFDTRCPVVLERTVISQTRGNSSGKRGWGLSVQDAQATLRNSAVFDHYEVGVFSYGHSALTIDQSSISAIHRAPDGLYGIGLFGRQESLTEVTRTDVRNAAGMGLLFDNAGATVFDSFVTDNIIGLHTQRGSTLRVQATAPAAPEPGVVIVGDSTQFSGNESRLGSGEYPVPSPF